MTFNVRSLFLIFIFLLRSSESASIHAINSSVAHDISTANTEYVGYVGDPNGRGTASLVISCLLTLILCVWSALHLNIPDQTETTFQCLMVNLRWILAGIYAPELVVFTAWRQWSSARILSGIVRDEETRKSETYAAEYWHHPWTRAHSFFASTGGFAFEIEKHDHTEFLPSGTPARLAITARGMALLARCGRLPNVAQAEITDKSKANEVAKTLVLLQASWMLAQVFGRLIAGLPVTLLEVNTIAHV